METLHSIALLLQQPTPFLVASLLLGAVMGSFLTMLTHRLPRMLEQAWHTECQTILRVAPTTTAERENLAFPRSYCPSCHQPIHWYRNIPLLGYLAARGRCNHCNQPIPLRYLLLELLAIAVAAIATIHWGPGLAAIAAMGFGWTLLALLFIDLQHQLLPDQITLPLLWSGLILNQFSLFTSPEASLWGAIAGYLLLWIIFHLYQQLTGREGMGHGDFKLLAALGAWCGWIALPQILLIASIGGLLVGLPTLLLKNGQSQLREQIRTVPIPFSPFLAAAGWIALLWGEHINQMIGLWALR